MGSEKGSNVAYVPALDGIRAIAIVSVFLYHVGILQGGWVGVDIFFTLSGYLITLILLTEYNSTQSILLPQFFLKRACRLLPAAVVLIFVALALSFYFNDQFHDTKVDAVAALLYVEDFRYAFSPVLGTRTTLVHLWSLSIEEQFYLIWPFFLILSLSSLGQKRSLYIVFATIALVILWRFALLSQIESPTYYRIYFSFDTRVDELLIGSALALWGYRPGHTISRTTKTFWPLIVLLFVAIMLALDPVTKWEAVSIYPLIGGATAFLIVIVTTKERTLPSRFLTLLPLVALGRISYGFYLWHLLIIHEVTMGGFKRHVALLAFVLTLAVSIGSYFLVERPILRFGRKAFSVGASSLEPARLSKPGFP
jgi:peptidoglycan/LPS O-acetylase OafA/YrhL